MQDGCVACHLNIVIKKALVDNTTLFCLAYLKNPSWITPSAGLAFCSSNTVGAAMWRMKKILMGMLDKAANNGSQPPIVYDENFIIEWKCAVAFWFALQICND